MGSRATFVCIDILALLETPEWHAGVDVVFLFMLPAAMRKMAPALAQAMRKRPGLMVVTAQWELPLPPADGALRVGKLPGDLRHGSLTPDADARDLFFYCADVHSSCLSASLPDALCTEP